MSILGPDARAVPLAQAGLPVEAAAALAVRLAGLRDRVAADPGRRGECLAWFVPGRIEVVGKHTDYGGGRSLVCAIERGLSLVARPRSDDLLAITDVRRASSVVLSPRDGETPLHWAIYPLTVLRRMTSNFSGPLRGADIAFDSDLPSAAGLSSSSALMVAVLLALARVNALETTAAWRENLHHDEDLAAFAATIENGSGFRGLRGERGVGTEGGSQDHTAILCSAPDRLTQFSYRPTRREGDVVLAPHLTFVVGVSGVRAQKTGRAREDYNRAAQAAAAILERARQITGNAYATLAEAIATGHDAIAALRASLADRTDLIDRLDQFVEESTAIVPDAALRLAAGDIDGFGRLVDRSQALAERLLRNQVPETIDLARLARTHGALAASAFGAGFGGSVWALIERARAARFVDQWQNAYRGAHPDAAARAAFFLARPGPPAFAVDLDLN
jgi:galactokinase